MGLVDRLQAPGEVRVGGGKIVLLADVSNRIVKLDRMGRRVGRLLVSAPSASAFLPGVKLPLPATTSSIFLLLIYFFMKR